MSKFNDKIQELCKRPFVKKKVIERFLLSVDIYDMKREQAEACLDFDSKIYKWDYHTTSAIREGLDYIYNELKKI